MTGKQRLIKRLQPVARRFSWFGFCRGPIGMAGLGLEEAEAAQSLQLKAPAWLDPRLDPAVFTKRIDYLPIYRGELPNAITTHQCGYVTADNWLVDEASTWFTHPVEDHRLFNSIRPFQKIEHRAGTVISLQAPAGLNFYHWLFDTLPKIAFLGLDRYPEDTPVYAQYDKPLFRETLSLLGIAPERIINSRDHQVLRADRLVLANHPMPCARPHPAAVRFWRDRLKPVLASAPVKDDVLFISRRDAQNRRLHREEELIRAAGGEGWRVLQMRGLSFREQLEAFHSARVVITTHGAALANLIACRPGTAVLEILNPNLACYQTLAQQMDMRYHAMPCDGEARTPEGKDELVVDPGRLREAVRRVLEAAG